MDAIIKKIDDDIFGGNKIARNIVFWSGFIILLSLVYVFSVKTPTEKPYQILTPKSYEKGTVVALYKGIPPNFPKEVVLENKTLDYSGSVISPQSRIQTTVSYISDKTMQDIVNLYTESLPKVGWNISMKSVYAKVTIIKAVKNNQSILLTIAPLEDRGVMVTFQYEK